MVAVRPYAISPQYLFMINDSINNIHKDRLQINFVSGSSEKDSVYTGGILETVNSLSLPVEKSNYLINYINVLEDPNKNPIDYYISVNDESMVNKTLKHKSKLIIPYLDYKNNVYDIKNRDVMVYLRLVLRKNNKDLSIARNKYYNKYFKNPKVSFFTYEEFENILDELKNKKINKVLIHFYWDEEEKIVINNFVKKYKEKEWTTNK
jgi:hypothetical protein